ncbi:hypothetical protein HKBW3S47_02485, partial [Candidatus Hakubella thermalkaliphila]
ISLEFLIFILYALIPLYVGDTSFHRDLKLFLPHFIALAIRGKPIGATMLELIIFK